MEYVVGIDVGTSACKATLLDRAGLAVTSQSEPYDFDAPQPEWAEQDPAVWQTGARQSVERVRSAANCRLEDIVAVGVTGQMHTAVLLGSRGEVLRPAMLWCDQRAVRESQTAEAAFPAIREITLNPLLPAFTLAKILWAREHEPDVYRQIGRVLLPKDYLRYLLTGIVATDPSDAAGTAMFDARSWRWSDEVVSHFDIPVEWLPASVPSSQVVGPTNAEGARLLGLPEGIPVIAGAGDQAAQAIGVGAVDPSILAIQLGTSGVVAGASDQAVSGAFCHAVPGRWLRLNSIHSGGLSLSWMRDAFAPERSLADLTEDAELVAPGADGILFMPFLLGERAGLGSSIPGVFYGAQRRHVMRDFVRALFEGVAFELRRMCDEWGGAQPREIRLTGGGGQNHLWQQIFADVFDLPLVYIPRDSAYGAAVLGARAVGWWEGAPPAEERARVQPDGRAVTAYRERYQDYRALYMALRNFAEATD